MARKHGHNWIPPAANNWGATCPASHKSPPPPAPGQERGNHVGVITPGTAGRWLWPKILDMMGFP
jgi:hypothetical protein